MHIVSLGSNCYPAAYIKARLQPVNKETQLFDTIGTSVWSINKLIEERFEGIVDRHNFKDRQHLEGGGLIATNVRYNLRFLHDLDAAIQARSLSFQAKVLRRVQRLEGIFREAAQLLLIRYQENQQGRIQYRVGSVDEYGDLCRFAALLRSTYGTRNFVIVYLTADPVTDAWNEASRILSVQLPTLAYSFEECAERIGTILDPMLPFVQSKLDPPPSAAHEKA